VTVKKDGAGNKLDIYSWDGKEYVKKNYSEIENMSHVINVSAGDPAGSGVNNLIVNVLKDAVPVVMMGENPRYEDCGRLSLSLGIKEESRLHTPGGTYYVVYDSGKRVMKAAQGVHTSYPSLKNPGVHVGLGKESTFIDSVFVRTNSKNQRLGHFSADNLIILNTSLVFCLENGVWYVGSYFLTKRYNEVMVTLMAILLLNVGVLIVMSLRDINDRSKNHGIHELRQVFGGV
jgi:hypothetical protein